MPYITSATERTTGPGNTNETKALFYFMGQDRDSVEIDYFIIDVFNDVSGSDNTANRLWDIQSKNQKSGPKQIGAGLVTLFKNYMSEFRHHFVRSILFLGDVTDTVCVDSSLSCFSFSNIKPAAQAKIKEALREELLSKQYIDNAWVTNENIDAFLSTIEIILGTGDKASFVRPLIEVASSSRITDARLEAIFNEVRRVQSDKKNIVSEGISFNFPHEAFKTGKVLSRREIERLVLGRIINKNPIASGIPRSFIPIYSDYPPESADEMLEDCQNAVALQLFDKNSKDSFWALFDNIVKIASADKSLDVQEIYQHVDFDLLASCVHLSPLAAQYFIAEIKDGLKQ